MLQHRIPAAEVFGITSSWHANPGWIPCSSSDGSEVADSADRPSPGQPSLWLLAFA